MALKSPVTLADQVTARPVDISTLIVTAFNLVVSGPVVFGLVHFTAEQLAWVYGVGNVLAQLFIWRFLRRTTTPLADPKTAEGVKLEPVKPATRGIPKA